MPSCVPMASRETDEHLQVRSASVPSVPSVPRHVLPGRVESEHVVLEFQGECVFEAQRVTDSWEVKLRPPLSHFHAVGIMTGVLDDASSASFHK